MSAGAATQRIDRTTLFAVPLAAYLAFAFVVPLVLLLLNSFRGEAGFTVGAYASFLSDAYNLKVVWNSLKLGLLCTLVCLAVGYPAAVALARAGPLMQTLVLAAMFLPLSVSVIVKAFGWTILLRDNGVVNLALQALGLTDEPVRFIFTETGLLIGISNVFLPFMVLPIYTVIGQIDRRLFDAAATLGANPVQRFLGVLVPLSLPGVIAGVALVFSLAVSAYVIPTLLIGDRHQLLSTQMAKYFLFLRNEQFGSVTAVILLAIAIVIVVASAALARRFRAS